jgi:uncharacterized repeat protein (TIGR03803 family)
MKVLIVIPSQLCRADVTRSWVATALLCSGIVLLACAANADVTFSTLHSFTGSPDDGEFPFGNGVTVSGSTIYGIAKDGGSAGFGAIFRMNIDGSGYTVLHSFAGTYLDGAYPVGNLTIVGSSLFGATYDNEQPGSGRIFKMNTDGTGLSYLHYFSGGADDGLFPLSGVTASGSTLYGTTSLGGPAGGIGEGLVYKINSDGTGFAVLHLFNNSDGREPQTTVTLVGDTLYGTTISGGAVQVGSIFKVKTDGTGFRTLRSFEWNVNGAGYHPIDALLVSGSTIYGSTGQGGAADAGSLFKMNIDGSGFSILHAFNGGPSTGAGSISQLILSGNQLYGACEYGSSPGDRGFVYQLNTDGTGFVMLHSFTDTNAAIGGPTGDLFLANSTLYGITASGGSARRGSVFALKLSAPEPNTSTLILIGLAGFAILVAACSPAGQILTSSAAQRVHVCSAASSAFQHHDF